MAMQLRQRTVSPATWARMTDKAVAEHIQCTWVTGEWFETTSGTQPGVHYTTSQHACSCPGHTHHGYCKHQARVRQYVTWLVRNGLTVD